MKIISLDKGCFAFILGLLLWCSHMHANYLSHNITISYWQSAVSGTVSDTAGTLPGVTVFVKGKSISTITDEKGQYSINAALGDTLVFSFVGFKDKELIVTAPVHNVTLEENTTQLGEVVINAGYYNVRQKESTGSISRITAKEIEGQPVTNVLATMQGRMPGVHIVQGTGVAGGGFDIRIRGQNSLRDGGNAPLYIIDGVPYSSENIGNGQTSTVLPAPTSPLNSINPSEIESIEVLKDADATAIYGSRGANGVVLITTKKGKAGKTTVSATYSRGFGRVTGFMDMLSTEQYIQMREEAFANDGIPIGPADFDVNGTYDRNRYTDWQDVLLGGTADITSLQASVSGGSEKTQFLLTGTYNKETTVFPGDFGYGKGGARLQVSHRSDDGRFTANATAGYTAQKNEQPGLDPTPIAAMLVPNAPALYDSEGNLNWEGSTWINPLGEFNGKFRTDTHDFIANTLLSYTVLEGLTLRSSFGFTDTRHLEDRTMPNTIYDPAYGIGPEFSTLYLTTTSRQSYIIEPQLAYTRQWEKLKLEALAGTTFQQLTGAQLAQSGTGFSSNSLIYNLAAATSLDVASHLESDYRYNAVFARVNLNWDRRYIVNLTGRRDGSSRFGPGRRFANFGAVGAAWLFSSEEFLSGSTVLSYGKLRGSYGTTGNDQIGDYQFLDSYAVSPNTYGGSSGLQPTRLFNPDYGWETNRKLEVGLETGWLKDRILFSAGWFRNRSSSQLVGVPLPATTGFTSIQANLDAVVENSGWEFSLTTVNVQKPDFTWSTGINLTIARNRLVAFPDLEGSSYENLYVIGQPLNIRKVYEYTGIDPQTGLYQFRDFNGDGILTGEDDRQAVRDLNPRFFGGVSNSLSYKGITLDFLFQFVSQDNYNEKVSSGPPGTFANQPAAVMDRWTSPGSGGQYQRFTTGADSEAVTAFNRFMNSTGVISDASFIRLKNIALSYTLPKNVTPRLGCRVFLEGQNLLTITGYKGRDPEFAGLNYLPPLKIISTGIQLTF
ncbi:SusC/RagA family TonB-linked outer membrane protein [Flavobacterium sp. MK4S-17]|uniref:SusC/RagA family TonB-linked outer membrane protein n=1 Tax=Flavobacterium sp. MK4S-17 TaxID=2543737 RepID=UPI00135CE4CC|nr:SusC/RagA family TonB-linked outer membrane protein [Flavobacterium sp. MK4S-17]